jgi:hypothetical protein
MPIDFSLKCLVGAEYDNSQEEKNLVPRQTAEYLLSFVEEQHLL